MAEKGRKKRITRDQWLSRGIEFFAAGGVEGLRVEKLAEALGVAKSGFYWHFRDREEFLDKIFDYWAHEYTEVISRNPLVQQLPPRDRLMEIMTIVFEQDLTELDAAMHMWSKTDPRIARKVRKVMSLRLELVRKAFEELGFTGDELEMRARTLAAFQMGERPIFGANRKTSQKYRERRLEMLLAGAADTSKPAKATNP